MICGSVMKATMRISSPQRGHASGSTSKMRRSNSAQRLLPSAEALAQRLGLGVDAYAWVFLTCLTPHAPDPGRVPAVVALQDLALCWGCGSPRGPETPGHLWSRCLQ
jgi:hypothetical protein